MPTNSLLTKAKVTGNPVCENGLATFVWQGLNAPLIMDDLHNWDASPQKMTRFATGLWKFTIALPADAYLEYAFIHPRTGERMPDPLNPRSITNGNNEFNHFFYMPNGGPSSLVLFRRSATHGIISRHSIPTMEYAVGTKRPVYFYRPPVDSPVPLLIVYDGLDYFHRARLNIVVDNLIEEKRIRPIALAFVQNSRSARNIEYSCCESTIGFLMECVLPVAKKNLNLEPIKFGNYGILGSSLGGSMALFTGLRLPQVFRKILSQSGAFIAPDYNFIVVDLVKYMPAPEIDIWLDAGRLEWLLDGNRQMATMLKEGGYKVKYREFSGGHNFTSWRNDISHGIEALYPPI